MGGTFDPFHIGHEALIQKAVDVGQEVLIGLTTDKRAKQGRQNYRISSYTDRKNVLDSWLQSRLTK